MKLDRAVQKVFEPQLSAQQNMLVAVSAEDPDARRRAVTEISKSNLRNRDWAVRGFMAIALLETDPQTRCVALRALGRTRDPRGLETALKILNFNEHPAEQVWPPVDLVRWDATKLIADAAVAGRVPEDLHAEVRRTLLARLASDTDRHARREAARGLVCCPDVEVLAALVAGLRDQDFAVTHECECTLVTLTGETHHGNPFAWEQWLAEHHAAAFVKAGNVPESRQPPYRNGVEWVVYETQQLVQWLWPGSAD